MQIFNQQNQTVGHQVNAMYSYSGSSGQVTWPDIESQIQELIGQLRSGPGAPAAVEPTLRRARAAAGARDERAVRKYLRAAAEAAPHTAAVVAGAATIVQALASLA